MCGCAPSLGSIGPRIQVSAVAPPIWLCFLYLWWTTKRSLITQAQEIRGKNGQKGMCGGVPSLGLKGPRIQVPAAAPPILPLSVSVFRHRLIVDFFVVDKGIHCWLQFCFLFWLSAVGPLSADLVSLDLDFQSLGKIFPLVRFSLPQTCTLLALGGVHLVFFEIVLKSGWIFREFQYVELYCNNVL